MRNLDVIYVDRSLKKKLLQVKLDSNFKNLNDVVTDMYSKCYPEEVK
jgi:hypothetical protein